MCCLIIKYFYIHYLIWCWKPLCQAERSVVTSKRNLIILKSKNFHKVRIQKCWLPTPIVRSTTASYPGRAGQGIWDVSQVLTVFPRTCSEGSVSWVGLYLATDNLNDYRPDISWKGEKKPWGISRILPSCVPLFLLFLALLWYYKKKSVISLTSLLKKIRHS